MEESKKYEASENTSENSSSSSTLRALPFNKGLTRQELEHIKTQMGLNNWEDTHLQVSKIGQLLKEWKLIPKNHIIDEKIMFGILDRDRNGVFSFDDFLRTFPKYNTQDVEKFMSLEKKKSLI